MEEEVEEEVEEEGTHLFDLFVSTLPRGFSNVKRKRNECYQAQTLGALHPFMPRIRT